MPQTKAPRVAIGLFTCDGLDQITDLEAVASRERRDLIKLGCTVSLYRASDESTLYAIDSWIRHGASFATARARVESGTMPPAN